jgi:hypothetical protein
MDEAEREAERIGRKGEHKYRSMTGEEITVSFDRVLAAFEIAERHLTSGTEIFSRSLLASEAESLKESHGNLSL